MSETRNETASTQRNPRPLAPAPQSGDFPGGTGRKRRSSQDGESRERGAGMKHGAVHRIPEIVCEGAQIQPPDQRWRRS